MNILYIYIYRHYSWNCFWYIMFSLILQCCISFLVTLLPAYLKGTVWLWILQKQMYKRSCTMSQMWRPRRLGTSLLQIDKHPGIPFWCFSFAGNFLGQPYHCVRKDERNERNERICGGQITRFSFVDQCSSEGPFKRGLRNFAWTVKSKIRKSLSAPSFGCVQLGPRGVQRLSLGKKNCAAHFPCELIHAQNTSVLQIVGQTKK